ncbi:hypothetical protein [Wohlfahrtiimonas chitiniclastica]|uniref:hypothetical protein n=1 Tax=Wohlfahrtiimonas chitiniclastica TaxID=400946 RepID=UPI00037DEC55|nr:hypothetical protein [Wohlfahrtiimonas chitiniclastica]
MNTDVGARINALDNKLVAAESDTTERVKAIEDKISTSETDVDARINTLDNKLVAAESDTTERVKAIEDKISTSETDVDARINTLDNKLVAAESDTTERVKAIEDKISTSETDVDARINTLDNKLVAAESDTTERVKAIEDKISTSETDVGARINALDNKLVAAESNTTERVKAIEDKISTSETDVDTRINALDNKLSATETGIVERINTLEHHLFGENGTEAKIDDLEEKLFAEDGAESRINALDEKLDETNNSLDAIQAKTKEQAKELENFFAKQKDAVDKKIIEYENTYKGFTTKIEDLLPAAMSAGLASSYKAAKETFDKKITFYNRALIGLFCVLAVFGGYNVIKYANLENITLLYVFSKILLQLPILGLLVWITIFVSSKLNECVRLQQEYAHKESIASSYSSFKQQIESIESDQEKKMLENLMGDLIQNVSFNPSTTLDKQQPLKHPVKEIIDTAANIAQQRE